MSFNNISYQINSALFHVVDNLIITREGLSFSVGKIFTEEDKSVVKINNELRLKNYLFSEISKRYNTRINVYNLLFHNIPKSFLNKFNIYGYKTSQRESSFSAYCDIFPKTFVCKNCGHFISFKKSQYEELNSFDFNTCKLGCGGSYEQIFQLKFCEECGNLEDLTFYCSKHPNSNWILHREDKFQPRTWKLSCQSCTNEDPNYEPLDILRYTCSHRNRSNKDPSRYTLLTATEGSIFQPVVLTMVDIPESKMDSLYLDYIILGLYLNRFNDFLEKYDLINEDYTTNIQNINEFLGQWDNKFTRKTLPQDMKDDIIQLYELIDELIEDFDDYSFVNINDYMVLSGMLSKDIVDSTSFDSFIEGDEVLIKKFDKFKERYKISQIYYLSNINLVSSVIGVNVGLNKFYEENFIPHFEPLWENAYEKDSLKSYVVPFETEGLMFNLDKCAVVNWLIDNNALDMEYVDDETFATKILMEMDYNSYEYSLVKKLIHTLSHVLIRRSSLYTGLEDDSCGEMLFVNSASFLLYSSSSINIGGFSFIFENALFKWFEDIELYVDDCVLDPSCIHESGACFSCMYLPEYVCSEFNMDLDRDVLIGKTNRYSKGFW